MLWPGHLQTSLCLSLSILACYMTFSDAFDFTLQGREEENVSQSEYFHWGDQQGITWSIQAQGTPLFSSFCYPGRTRPALLTRGVASTERFLRPNYTGDVPRP